MMSLLKPILNASLPYSAKNRAAKELELMKPLSSMDSQVGSRHEKLHSLWGEGSDIVFDMQAKQGGLHKTQLAASLALAQVSLII